MQTRLLLRFMNSTKVPGKNLSLQNSTRLPPGKALFLAFTALFILAGCAEKKKEFAYQSWPHPNSIRQPKQPKLAYITTYHGGIDFEKQGIADQLFGARPEGRIFRRPTGIVTIGDYIYVAQLEGGSVAVVDTVNGKMEKNIGDTGELKLVQPTGITAGADGTLYVTDLKRKDISVYDQNGNPLRIIGGGEILNNPVSVAVNDELNRLYVADSKAHTIKVFSLSGDQLFDFGKRGRNDGEFNFPTSITADKRNGDLYIVDSQNNRVQVFDKDGKFIRKFGKAGDAMGQFSLPKSISMDSEGNVYVLDSLANIFQVLSDTGEPHEFYGAFGGAPGQLLNPSSIYVDGNDRIYISDLYNRVLVFQSMNDKWIKAHPEEYQKYLQAWEAAKKDVRAMEQAKDPTRGGKSSKSKKKKADSEDKSKDN